MQAEQCNFNDLDHNEKTNPSTEDIINTELAESGFQYSVESNDSNDMHSLSFSHICKNQSFRIPDINAPHNVINTIEDFILDELQGVSNIHLFAYFEGIDTFGMTKEDFDDIERSIKLALLESRTN